MLQQWHAEFMLRLAERPPSETFDAAHASQLRPEEDNMRAALEWAVQHDEAEVGLRLAAGALRIWSFSGHYLEGSGWLERLVALPSALAAPAARATALVANAQLLVMLGE